MGQNIEVKDVHQTEYLDKNGLDMLWAKVKENANNQVEVERNRAVAKENSITNSLNEFVRKTSDDDQTINSDLMIIGGIGIAAENIENTEGVGLTPTRVEFSHANNRSSIQLLGIDVDRQNGSAIEIKTNCENPYITLSDGTNDNHDNGQTLSITNKGITCNNHTQNDGYFFAANGEIKDIYNTLDINIHRNFIEGINTSISNEGLSVFRNTVDGTNGIKITDSGILVNSTLTENSSPNKVFATDGSIADLTEYIKIASNITTKGFGSIRTVDAINNNIGVGDNTSSLAYIGKGELGAIKYNGDGYATESFRYTSTYGLETTNTRGYKNVKIPCDQNQVQVYKSGSNDHYTKYGYSGVQLGENNDDSNLLNTNGSYKTIGTDITPLENGKVPAEYLDLSQYAKKSEITAGGNVDDVQVNGVTVVENKIANIKPATKEEYGVVKVGDGLNVTDGTISVDTTAIGAGNYVSYKSIRNGDYYEMSKGLFYQYDNGFSRGNLELGPTSIIMDGNSEGDTIVYAGGITLNQGDNEMLFHAYDIDFRFKGSQYFVLNENGVRLKDGDDNHVLTSNASTIDITQYVLKSVYDEKIAALEARIAALEAKHTETA